VRRSRGGAGGCRNAVAPATSAAAPASAAIAGRSSGATAIAHRASSAIRRGQASRFPIPTPAA
jgi:hypothetical protein